MTTKKQVVETEEQKRDRENIEAIASNISALANSVRTLLGGKLKQKALVILLAHSSGLYQHEVTKVLEALQNLDKDWLH